MTDYRNQSGACPAEWQLSVYVDRELEPGPARAVEAHMEGCADCRERVTALEDEAHALRVAFAAEDFAAAPAAAPKEARSVVFAALSVAAAAVLALTALGELLDLRLPVVITALLPVRAGAFSLLFDLVDSLGNVLDVVQFVARVAALLLSTTLLSAALPRWLRRSRAAAFAGLACVTVPLLGTPGAAAALELRFGEERAVLPAGEVAEETWLVQAETVTIDGTLRGDLIAVAERVIVSGTVEGNVVTGARRVEVSGSIGGSLLAVAERVHLDGSVAQNVYTGAGQATIADSGSVGRDLASFGEGLEISGVVGRDALTYVKWLDLRGHIERDLTLRADRADLLAGSRVGGDLHATYDPEEGGVNIDPRADVGGEVTLDAREDKASSVWERYTSRDFYVGRLLSFAAALVFGVLLFRLAPWLFTTEIHTGADVFRFMGLGLAGVVVTPVAVVLLALTLIGIPVALLALVSFVAGLYAANLLVGVLIGAVVLGRDSDLTLGWQGFARVLGAGLAIVFVALALPFVGGVLRVLALLLGFGALTERVWSRVRPA